MALVVGIAACGFVSACGRVLALPFVAVVGAADALRTRLFLKLVGQIDRRRVSADGTALVVDVDELRRR